VPEIGIFILSGINFKEELCLMYQPHDMKKTSILIILLLLCFAGQKLLSNSQGALRVTGSNTTAACAGCHAGKQVNSDPLGSVTMSIEGSPEYYVPGNTYEVTVKTSYPGRHKFGFACDATDSNGTDAGIFSAGGNSETQELQQGSYITHTLGGTLGHEDSRTWKFNWTAPLGNIGDVTLYVGSVAANANNMLSGDLVYKTTLTLHSKATVAIEELIDKHSLTIFPLPAHSYIDLSFNANDAKEISASLYDLNGKKLEEILLNKTDKGINHTRLYFTQAHASGIYMLNIEADGYAVVRKIMIN
jgi:hypothetical protein